MDPTAVQQQRWPNKHHQDASSSSPFHHHSDNQDLEAIHRFLDTVQNPLHQRSLEHDAFIPPLPTLRCDPCIRRSEYRMKMITHGTNDEAFWWNVRAAAVQAALDMGVFLEFELYPIAQFSGLQMATDIYQAAGISNSSTPPEAAEASSSNPPLPSSSNWDALIVTIYDIDVQQAVQRASSILPIFAMNNGYDMAHQLGVLGYVGQDEYKAGQAAALEFLRYFVRNSDDKNGDNDSDGLQKALFVNHAKGNPGIEARLRGYNDTLRQRTNGAVIVEELVVSRLEVFDLVTQVNDAFQECQYDVVLLAGSKNLHVALKAMSNNQCGSNKNTTTITTDNPVGGRSMIMGCFDDTDDVLKAVAQGDLLFTISQQQYLQGVIPVVLASLYATTQMKLNFSGSSFNNNKNNNSNDTDTDANNNPNVFESGPAIINRNNLPSDTQQVCTADAFPVCPQTLIPDGTKVSSCDCLDRSTLRIGGVLHGVRTGKFWDIIFAAAESAATDMGVELDMVRFDKQESNELLHSKMAARIKSLCESGVDGVFVSIPSDIVMEAVRDECQALDIPVISVNAGGEVSKALELIHHVGMNEYGAGHAAGKRLVNDGMKIGYCIDHNPGDSNLQQRCQGFEDAIRESESASYGGTIDIIFDNTLLSVKAVLDAVTSNSPDWDDVGLLLLDTVSLPVAYQVQDEHPGVLVGSFDLNEYTAQGLAEGRLLWAIDQQAYLQGALPVYLLSYEAHTRQVLINHAFETGPTFVERPPSEQQQQCYSSFFRSCPTRPTEDFNYIDKGLKIAGYVVFGGSIFLALASLGWMVAYMNESPIIRASQPIFLGLIIFGALVSSMTILAMGVETGYRYSVEDPSEQNPDIERADAACMAVWWLYGIGFGLIFSALFAKIYRVKLIFQAGQAFRRVIVNIKDVANILILMMVVEVGILLSWQLVSPERWHRTVLRESEEGYALESVGRCTSDNSLYFKIALIVFHLLCLLYALVLCFRTKHLNSDYAETSYISLAVICMFQILVVAMPIYAMVEEDSNIYYFVRASVVFLQNFTVIGLIFFPKMLRVYQGKAVNVTKAQSRASIIRSFLSPSTLLMVNTLRRSEEEERQKWSNDALASGGDSGPNDTQEEKCMTCDACGHRLSCLSCGSVKFLRSSHNRGDGENSRVTFAPMISPFDDDVDEEDEFDGDKDEKPQDIAELSETFPLNENGAEIRDIELFEGIHAHDESKNGKPQDNAERSERSPLYENGSEKRDIESVDSIHAHDESKDD